MNTYEPPGGLPWGLFVLAGGSLLLNAALVTRFLMEPELAPLDCEPAVETHAAMVQAPVVAEPVPETLAEPVEDAALEEPLPAGLKNAKLTVHHSLARTFQDGIASDGAELSAKVARLFVWDMDLRRDLQAGDGVAVAWTGQTDALEVQAARYTSRRHGTLEAFRFHAPSDTYPSWWAADGTEMARHLKNSPITGYEQITSLLKDRPRHRGMDFKTPVGTPVKTPKAGTIVRTNWNQRNNGNCVEVRFGDGTLARFLHLSRTDAKAGERVSAGTVVGLSGNTGRSTAPHLHYELEKNKKVVDPVDYHGIVQRTLSDADREGLNAQVALLRPAVK